MIVQFVLIGAIGGQIRKLRFVIIRVEFHGAINGSNRFLFGVNQNIVDFERDQYDPEIAETWELGYKSQHLDNRLRLNVSLFYNDFEDKQESLVEFDPTTNTVKSVFRNASSVTYKGAEVEAQFVFNQYVRGFLNYGYLDAEYDEFETDLNPNDLDTTPADGSFLNPRNAPENTWGVGGTISIPAGPGSFEIFAKFTRIDELDTHILNIELGKLEERDDLTATIGYYTDNWSIAAFGRNLTDERTEIMTPIANLFAVGSVNRPRSLGVEFTYEF